MTQIFKKTLLTSLVLFLMTACSDDKKELKIIVVLVRYIHYTSVIPQLKVDKIVL